MYNIPYICFAASKFVPARYYNRHTIPFFKTVSHDTVI